jgi:hypothetical protein
MRTKRKQGGVSFEVSVADRVLITKIISRAITEGLIGVGRDARGARIDLEMDLSATHANGCPLDFAKLLRADRFNFAHDICGIVRHLDRTTGELTQCFDPRCSRPQVTVNA